VLWQLPREALRHTRVEQDSHGARLKALRR
jgi:hypothetical protein